MDKNSCSNKNNIEIDLDDNSNVVVKIRLFKKQFIQSLVG